MRYKTHPYIGWIALGVALGSVAGVVGLVSMSSVTTSDDALVAIIVWIVILWWIAVIGGIVASHTLPTQFERKHAVRHAQRPVGAMTDRPGSRTPGHP
jgi:hypothetical protein